MRRTSGASNSVGEEFGNVAALSRGGDGIVRSGCMTAKVIGRVRHGKQEPASLSACTREDIAAGRRRGWVEVRMCCPYCPRERDPGSAILQTSQRLAQTS